MTDSSSSSISSHGFAGPLPVTVPKPVAASFGFPDAEVAGIDTLTRSFDPSTSSDAATVTSAETAEGPVNVTVDPLNATPDGDPD
ncbi:MAG: hypothetical protein F4129_09935, partial [Acidimicrobiia bacterium]|nr:hypothetical protein [Acidimicrobiia bacterium]